MNKKRFLLFSVSCLTLGLLLGAAVSNRTPLVRAFLQSDLDGNLYGLTNLARLQIATNAAAGRIPVSDATGNLTLTDGPSAVGATNIVNAQIAANAAIDKSKISTNGTWAATDMPAFTGDVTTSAGSTATTLGNGTVTDAKVASGAGIAWSKLDKTGSSLADLTTRSASDLESGTVATARLGSGTANSTTVLSGDQTYKQIADAQVSSGAAIGWSKIDKTGSSLADLATRSASDLSSGTVAAARLGTIQTAADGGSHAMKMKSFIVLAFPHSCDGAGAIIYTNDNSKPYFGQAAFSGSGATNANYVEYRLTVPEDIDTSVDLKVERWKVRLGAADTNALSFNIGMASVADSAGYDSPTLGQWVAINIAADASGASGDVETVSNVTLTSWKSNLTAGQLWVIRVNRDGTDASTQASYSGPLVISYGSTQ